jgi:hypothetical protein
MPVSVRRIHLPAAPHGSSPLPIAPHGESDNLTCKQLAFMRGRCIVFRACEVIFVTAEQLQRHRDKVRNDLALRAYRSARPPAVRYAAA